MKLLQVIFSFFTLFQFAYGFYPWIPEYRCILDHTCLPSKREVEDNVGSTASFKIVQRHPKNDMPHAEQINNLAAHLKKKHSKAHEHNRILASDIDLKRDSSEIMKRTNTYSIDAATSPTQANSAGIDQDGTDFSYFAEVLLGTDTSPLYMLLDTGAGQSWVMGPDCTSAACEIHNSFGASDSTTFKAVEGSSFSIGYGSGSVSGIYGNDTVSLAGLTVPLTLGIANVTSPDFTAFPMDGILGLSQAPGAYPNFIQALVTSKALKSNLFGVSISRASDGPNHGEINFGAPDTSRYTGSLNYIPVSPNSQGDWAIPMEGLGSEGKDAGVTGKLAYIDTGTSYIFAPADDVTKFHNTVAGSISSDGSTWTVPCTTTTPLTFTFSGTTYNVPSEDWVGPVANGVCTSNVYGQEVVTGQWLLGDTFLKNVYTVFDIDGNRIGFGTSSASSATTSSGATSSTGGTPSSPSSSTAAPSATTVFSSGSVSVAQTSNSGPTGSPLSTLASQSLATIPTTSGSATSSETGTPGLNGHQSSDASGTVAADSTTAPAASPTGKSAAAHVGFNLPTIIFVALSLTTLLS